MSAALFAQDRYELSVAGTPLSLLPVPVEHAEPLGIAFAAMDPWATYGYPASAITSYLAGNEKDGKRFVLLLDGEIAGAFGLQMTWLRGPYLRFLAILPAFQGRRIGSAVLAWFEAQARMADERNLWVVASQINTGAIRFYERHGFTQAALLDGLAYDDRVEILLRKRLIADA